MGGSGPSLNKVAFSTTLGSDGAAPSGLRVGAGVGVVAGLPESDGVEAGAAATAVGPGALAAAVGAGGWVAAIAVVSVGCEGADSVPQATATVNKKDARMKSHLILPPTSTD